VAHVTYANKRVLDLTGFPDLEALNAHWERDSTSRDTNRQFYDLWDAVEATGGRFSMEFPSHRLEDGSKLWLFGQWQHDCSSGVLYSALTDVSELRQLQKERLDALSKAEQAQRERAEEAELHQRSQVRARRVRPQQRSQGRRPGRRSSSTRSVTRFAIRSTASSTTWTCCGPTGSSAAASLAAWLCRSRCA
jgi:hypothetical protein